MKILVTGATGFVGEEILAQLQRAGHSIRILARNPASDKTRAIAARFNAGIHQGDVTEGAGLVDGLRGVDAVIHLVGIISEIGENTFEAVHARGTQNMVRAAKMASIKRFIHMSALGTRSNAVARYHRSKWAAEEIVRHSGLEFTIFRPSIIYGPRDQFVNLFARMAKVSPALPVLGDGKSRMQPIPVSDVAKCFVGALTEPKSIGQTFDLCGPDALRFNEILDAILLAIHRKRLKLHIPMVVARIQAAFLELISPRFLRKAPPFNRDQLLMLLEDNVGNSEPANALFDLKPISFQQGISAYLR